MPSNAVWKQIVQSKTVEMDGHLPRIEELFSQKAVEKKAKGEKQEEKDKKEPSVVSPVHCGGDCLQSSPCY